VLPFPTIDLGPQQADELFGTVTNRLDVPGDDVLQWLRERCGRSEEAHAAMKSDLAGGPTPSQDFGVSAAWWSITGRCGSRRSTCPDGSAATRGA
jgi:hypothetical protein